MSHKSSIGNWERHQPYSDGPRPSNDGRKHLFAGKHRRKISEIPEEDLSKRFKRNTSSHSGAAADGTAVDDLSSGLVQHDPFEQSRGPGPPVFSMGGHQEPVRLNTNSNPGNYLSIYCPLNEASSTNSTVPYGADWPPVISRPSKAPINSSQDFHPYQPFPFNQEYPQFNEQAYSGNPLVQGAIEAMPVAMQYLPSGYETASEAFVGQDINPALSEASALSLSHSAVGQDVELDASLDWKIQSLPILDNLASQILFAMATSSPAEMIACMTNPRNNEHGTLKSLFEHTKKAFTRDNMMINPNALPPEQPASYDILRRANIVTFLVSIFDSRGPDFILLNRLFLETFVPLGSRLYKWQGALFLELKTQAYISSMLSGSPHRQDVIDEFFPGNLELCLLMRRPASNQQISPSEQDFLKRVQTRRSYLLSEPDTPGAVTRLLKKYEWKDFLKEIINCAGRYVESSTPSAQTDESNTRRQSPTFSNNYPAPEEVAPSAPYGGPYYYAPQLSGATLRTEQTPGSLITPATHVVPAAFESSASPDPSSSQSAPQYLQMAAPPPHQYPAYAQPQTGGLTDNEAPPHSQSSSTQHQHSPARQAQPSKPSSQKHKPTIPTARRLWTSEEESALLDGLERVGGPHWSQILGLYGAGGTISEVLKDRNQIQLKDKARNLKLCFLKSGHEVPHYLQGVTGELRTRAPSQAARQEALAKAREMEMGGRGT